MIMHRAAGIVTETRRISRALPLVALALACGTTGSAGQWASPRAEVIFPDQTRVIVEVARTDAERARGLMFRDRLGPNEGMIFVFDEIGFYPFWMKNTLIPLDMLWLDPDRRVVSIAESVPPCRADPCPTYPPDAEALYVVEVNAGFVRRHSVKVGDQLELRDLPERRPNR